MNILDFGHFDCRATLGAYEPQEAGLPYPGLRHDGLAPAVQYFFGGLRDADGVTWAVQRKFRGDMTGGLWLMNDSGGDFYLHYGAFDTARGTVLRTVESSRRCWSNYLNPSVAAEFGIEQLPFGAAGTPMSLVVDHSGMSWSEGDLLSIKGALQGPGFQCCIPSRSEPLLFTTQIYWVTGNIAGTPAEGFIGLGQGYVTPGHIPTEYRYFDQFGICWQGFANKLVDGGVEYGMIIHGRRGWAGGVVFESGKLVAKTDQLYASYRLDSEGFVDEANFDIDGHGYTFVGNQRGKVRHFWEVRWVGPTSQIGVTRREGDGRPLDMGISWMESFPSRIRSGKLDRI